MYDSSKFRTGMTLEQKFEKDKITFILTLRAEHLLNSEPQEYQKQKQTAKVVQLYPDTSSAQKD